MVEANSSTKDADSQVHEAYAVVELIKKGEILGRHKRSQIDRNVPCERNS
jgi:hypothetical protein